MAFIQFDKTEMNSAKIRLRNFLKANKKLPNSIKLKDKNSKKTVTVQKREYEHLFEAQHMFIMKNGRRPNYVTLSGKSDNAVIANYQKDVYTCCVYSFQMCGQYLFDWLSPNEIKKAFKTDTSGTSPSNMISGAKTLGYKVSPIQRTYNAVKNCLENGYPVIAHIQTKNAKCLEYKYDYGHYIHLNKVKDGKFWVCDPSRTPRWCNAKEIINATNGRSIKFYKVEIL